MPVHQQFDLFCLGGVDVVFGNEWLASLGDMKFNFEQLTLTITVNGKKLLLQEDPELKRGTYMNSLFKALRQSEGFLIYYQQIQQI